MVRPLEGPWEEVHHRCGNSLCCNPEHLVAEDCDYHNYITATKLRKSRPKGKGRKSWTALQRVLVDGYRGTVVSVCKQTVHVLFEHSGETIELETTYHGMRAA